MKAALECIPCALRQTLRAVKFAGRREDAEKALRRVMSTLCGLSWDVPPMALGFEVYRAIRESLMVEDPYAEEKRRLNQLALKHASELKGLIRKSRDPLDTAIRLAIAGNVIDYGSLEKFDLKSTVERFLKEKPAIYDIDILREKLQKARSIIYFLDNAGEAVFDKLLAETIQSLYGEKHFIFVVRSTPIINDVSLRDVEEINLSELGSVEVRAMPSESLYEWLRFRATLEKWFKEADVALSKGQGNFELLSDYPGIFFMFAVKCEVVASMLKVKLGSQVLYMST